MKLPTLLTILLLTGGRSVALEFPKPVENAKAGDLTTAKTNLQAGPATLGTLTVPENWDQPAKLIHLPVVVLHSPAEKSKEPIFIFHGGPGLSNLQTQHDYAWAREKHDVVLLGYRGVDGSVSLAMPEVNALLKRISDPLSTAGLKELAAGLDGAAARLESTGVNCAAYNLDAVVADVEAARKALGYQKIGVSGGSYGGAVACYYCLSFPQAVERCALIEAAFPWTLGVTEPAEVDATLRRVSREWRTKPENVARSEDILQDLTGVLAALPREHNGVLIDPGTLRLITFMALYTKPQTEMVLQAVVAAKRGDYTNLAQVDRLWPTVVDLFNWGDLCLKTFSSQAGPSRDFVAEMSPSDSIIGSPLTLLGWGCRQFSSLRTKPLNHLQMQSIPVPTLLVYGSEEAAVSPRRQLRFFPQGRLEVLGNLGHMDVWEQANRLQKAFFDQ